MAAEAAALAAARTMKELCRPQLGSTTLNPKPSTSCRVPDYVFPIHVLKRVVYTVPVLGPRVPYYDFSMQVLKKVVLRNP